MENGNESLTPEAATPRLAALLSESEEGNMGREPAKAKKRPTPQPQSDESETEQDADEGEPETSEESEGDEPEDEPTDEESDDTEESDETDEEETDEEQPTLVTVRVDGEEVQVTLDEALAGYSRTKDYTKKTQAAAELKKQAEAKVAEANAALQQYAERLKKLDEAIEVSIGKEPDWPKLKEELEQGEYAAAREDWREAQEQRAKVRAEREAAEKQVRDQQATEYLAYVTREFESLQEKWPELKDVEKGKKAFKAVTDYGVNLGFSAEEMGSIADHRAILVLRKAMLHDQSEAAKSAAKAKLEEAKNKPVRGKTPTPKKKMAESTKAMLKARRTGNMKDAAAAISLMKLD